MDRQIITPRDDWIERVGVPAFTDPRDYSPDPYWNENAAYAFSQREISLVKESTNNLHFMCCQAVQHVIDEKLYHKFGIPEAFHDYVATTWNGEYPSIYGRIDLAFDGKSPPKLIEYEADTPAMIFEASILQGDWLRDHMDDIHNDQFNLIHEGLVKAWEKVAGRGILPETLYFTTCLEKKDGELTSFSQENLTLVNYMMRTAEQAGLKTKFIDISDIGWNGKNFYDLEDEDIFAFFKFYPWDWIAKEEFGQHFTSDKTGVIEPVWKMILDNKAILPILWEMYEDHDLLLPAYETADPFKKEGVAYVKKPKIGREGDRVEIIDPSQNVPSEADDDYIYQAYTELPSFDGNHAIVGSWVVNGVSSGLNMREDTERVTGQGSRFVPHYIAA